MLLMVGEYQPVHSTEVDAHLAGASLVLIATQLRPTKQGSAEPSCDRHTLRLHTQVNLSSGR